MHAVAWLVKLRLKSLLDKRNLILSNIITLLSKCICTPSSCSMEAILAEFDVQTHLGGKTIIIKIRYEQV